MASVASMRADNLSVVQGAFSQAMVSTLHAEGARSEPERPNILLGVTGSVAAIKLAEVVLTLTKFAEVKVVTTKPAKHFYTKEQLPNAVNVYDDEEDWQEWGQVGDPILHIELRKWADLLLIAPLSANSLAKLAAGMADNLLTCVVRAWDFKKPVLVAPAMNTLMWNSPLTGSQLATLRQLGVQVVPPVAKRLACGDVGQGAMAHSDAIAHACQVALGLHVGLALKREREVRRRLVPVSLLVLGLFTAIGVTFSSQATHSVLTDHPISQRVQRGIRRGVDSTRHFFTSRLSEQHASGGGDPGRKAGSDSGDK